MEKRRLKRKNFESSKTRRKSWGDPMDVSAAVDAARAARQPVSLPRFSFDAPDAPGPRAPFPWSRTK